MRGRRWRLLGLLGAAALVVALVVGVATASGVAEAQGPADCAGSGCHDARVAELAASEHAALSCVACHPDAQDHPEGYTMLSASEYFQMEICGTCHPDQFGTYMYDDGTATDYGGSPEKLPKYEAFPSYNTIIDGHGFVREYNEERTHKYMLQDHADIKRGKYEVCMQCKSTRVAYYWGSGRTAVLQNEQTVTWAPSGEQFTVPAGTEVTLATDVTGTITGIKYQVVAEVVWDGVLYTTYKKEGATEDQKRVWVAVYAMATDGLPADSPTVMNSAACNHCHDPHKTEFRLIRKELIRQVEAKGVNPYADEKISFADASLQDTIDTVCGQCHVEYVCGKSGVDGINRDYFPWAKVRELESIYAAQFPFTDDLGLATYSQDWSHGAGVRASAWPNFAAEYPIAVPLIKSQHPETETYWESIHYRMGRSCADCHMPKVTKEGGGQFTSHWFASPVKYLDPARAEVFADEFGVTLDAEGAINQCSGCHADGAVGRTAAIVAMQDAVYGKANTVQHLLAESLEAINAAQAKPDVDQAQIRIAVQNHRSAHVRWENLVVSENSMGFHNAEVSQELDNAASYATIALEAARKAVRRPPSASWPPKGRSYEFPIWYRWVVYWRLH
jgi:nitrite reductase (cytochrome c-552)